MTAEERIAALELRVMILEADVQTLGNLQAGSVNEISKLIRDSQQMDRRIAPLDAYSTVRLSR